MVSELELESNVESPTLVLPGERLQRGGLKFGDTVNHLLMAVPALPEPGEIPTPPAQIGEVAKLLIPRAQGLLTLDVSVENTSIDHIALHIVNLDLSTERELRASIKGHQPLSVEDASHEFSEDARRHLIETVKARALEEIKQLYTLLFDELIVDLQEASLNPKLLQSQQELLFEGMRQVQNVKPRMLELIMRDLTRRAERSESPAQPQQKGLSQITQDELDLVDLREFEESLAVKRLLRQAEDLQRGAFELMIVRYADLLQTSPRSSLLPLSLKLLIPSLKRALNQKEIPLELSNRTFDFTGARLLKKIPSIYASLNQLMKKAGILPALEQKQNGMHPLMPLPAKTPSAQPKRRITEPSGPDLSEAAAALGAEPNLDTVTVEVKKDKADFIRRLLAAMPEHGDASQASDALVSDLFADLRSDDRVADDLKEPLTQLESAFRDSAREDPSFLVNANHPLRTALDRMISLAKAENYPNPALQSEVLNTLDSLSRTQTWSKDFVEATSAQMERLSQQQQRLFDKNIARLQQVEQGRSKHAEALREAKQLFVDAFPDGQCPGSLLQLIEQGWLDLITLKKLRRPDSDLSRQLHLKLSSLNHALQRAAQAPLAEPELQASLELLKTLESELNETLTMRPQFQRSVNQLRAELRREAPLSWVQLAESGKLNLTIGKDILTRIDRASRLGKGIRRALALKPGTWLEERSRVKTQSLYLAWADHQDGHFVLANQRGQKVVSYNLIQLGRRINRQLLTKSGTTELAALDRSILSRINVFKPRKLENSQIDTETGALDQDHFTKQLCLAAEDARAKLQTAHLVLLTHVSKRELTSLYDDIVIKGLDLKTSEVLWNHNMVAPILGHLGKTNWGSLYFGLSTAAVRKGTSALLRALSEHDIDTGIDRVRLDFAAHIVTLDSTVEEAVLEAALSSFFSVTTLAPLAISESRMSQWDGSQAALESAQQRQVFNPQDYRLAVGSQELAPAQSGRSSKLLSFAWSTLDSNLEIETALWQYQKLRRGIRLEFDRWQLDTVFRWLAQQSESERVIPDCVITLSPYSMESSDFIDTVLDQISEYGVGTNRLFFRVNLDIGSARLERMVEFCQVLNDIGCQFIGYHVLSAHLEVLRELPLRAVEITQSDIDTLDDQQLNAFQSRLDSLNLLGFEIRAPSTLQTQFELAQPVAELYPPEHYLPLQRAAVLLDTLKH